MNQPDRDRIIAEEMGWTHLLNASYEKSEKPFKDFLDETLDFGDEYEELWLGLN